MRFPEFSGEWENICLGDISENISSGKTKSTTKEGKYVLIGSTGVIGNTSDADYSGNLILVARVGANAGLINYYSGDCGITDNTLIIKLLEQEKKFCHYVYHYLKHCNLNQFVFGSGQPLITGGMLKRLPIRYGTKDEINKVSSLFDLLEARIETQSKIIEEQETLLKSLREELLNQCSDSFTQCRIGDILNIGNGKDYQHLSNGDIPVYGTGGLMCYVNESLCDGESVCIGRKGTINKPMYLSGRFWTVDTLFYTHSFNGILPRFCYHLFCTIDWLTYNEASGVPSLSKSTIEKIPVSIPQIDIQKRIVQILDSIEEKINTDSNILLDYQKQKAYLLSRMFI